MGGGGRGEILVLLIRSSSLLLSSDLNASIVSFLTHKSINPLFAWGSVSWVSVTCNWKNPDSLSWEFRRQGRLSDKRWEVLKAKGRQDGAVLSNEHRRSQLILLEAHLLEGSRWRGIYLQIYIYLATLFWVLLAHWPSHKYISSFPLPPSSLGIFKLKAPPVYESLTLGRWCSDELLLTPQPVGWKWGKRPHRGTQSKHGWNCPEWEAANIQNKYSNNRTRTARLLAYRL